MLQDATDEIKRFIGKIGVFVARKQRLAIFPDGHIHMHACAVVACDGLGHESRGFAVGMGDVVNDVFIFLQLIGLMGQGSEDQAQLVLTARHFVVMFVDLHAHPLHGGEHFAADVLRVINGVHGEVAAFDTGAVAHVADFVVTIGIP